jgi:acetate kinase
MATTTDNSQILTINAGSSSIKFALYESGSSLQRQRSGQIDRIGLQGTRFTVDDATTGGQKSQAIDTIDFHSAATFLMNWFEEKNLFISVRSVGHRVVHGMHHAEPALVTDELLDELQRMIPYDPEHLPVEIELMKLFHQCHPRLMQIACFDTAFHHTMPRVAKLLPIPRRFDAQGIQRYGFHGLSYAFLMKELTRLSDPTATSGRVILAHLGSGASLAAVLDGKSMDTSMGFTPTSGLVMGTRSGDLDPGLGLLMQHKEQMSTNGFNKMINHQSGMLGISETSSDMQDLLALESSDLRAAEAVLLFCYTAKKWLGSFAAVLGGLDTLVFAGGIGENAPIVRERICEGLGYLGIELNPESNSCNKALISSESGRVKVRVIPTNEESMIAHYVRDFRQ